MTEDVAAQLAQICEEAANVLLDGLPALPADSDPTPFWEGDRRQIEASIGSDEPHRWINEIVSSSLSEAAHQLRAIASLLRAGTVTASLDPLVRAVVERVGLVNWVLDADVTGRQRAIRSSLARVVSLQHYRSAMARLEADAELRTVFRAERARLDGLILDWFDVERPLEDSTIGNPKPTKDATEWTVEGESYPTLTRLAQLGMAHSDVAPEIAAGSYDVLSGFCHPSVFFGQEHLNVGDDATVTYVYRNVDLEKLVRIAVLVFMDGVKHWVGYYTANNLDVIERLDASAAKLDTVAASL